MVDLSKANLGSGEDYRDGWINVDYNNTYNPDVVHNLNEEWPFPANSLEHILASHVFEHLRDLDFQFAEAARVLRPGGILDVRYPVGENAKTDHTHKYHLTYDSVLWFAQNWHEFSEDYQLDPSAPFDLTSRDVDMVVHGPLRITKPLLDYLMDRRDWGVWVTGWPCSSGEVRALFRRREQHAEDDL